MVSLEIWPAHGVSNNRIYISTCLHRNYNMRVVGSAYIFIFIQYFFITEGRKHDVGMLGESGLLGES